MDRAFECVERMIDSPRAAIRAAQSPDGRLRTAGRVYAREAVTVGAVLLLAEIALPHAGGPWLPLAAALVVQFSAALAWVVLLIRLLVVSHDLGAAGIAWGRELLRHGVRPAAPGRWLRHVPVAAIGLAHLVDRAWVGVDLGFDPRWKPVILIGGGLLVCAAAALRIRGVTDVSPLDPSRRRTP